MENKKENSNVLVDVEYNRLYINLLGAISKKDIEQIYTDIRFGVQDLQAGYDVITDLRHCKIGHLAGIPTFKKIMGFLSANGVNRVVRVVGTSKIIFKQISRITDSVSGYSAIYVSSLDEVEEVLSGQAVNNEKSISS